MEPTTAERLLVAALAFAAGLSVGLLVAPREGLESRRQLAGSAREAAQAARAEAARLSAPVAQAAREHAAEFAHRHVPLADDLDLLDARDLTGGLPPARP